MPIRHERKAVYQRALLAYLAEVSQAPMRQIMSQVEDVVQPTSEEMELHPSYNEPDWQSRLRLDSTVLTGAGWLAKDGTGVWSITAEGREALAAHSDTLTFWDRALRAYERNKAARRRRAWFVSGSSVQGVDLVDDWLARSYCSVATPQLRRIDPDIGPDDLRGIVETDYSDLRPSERRGKADEIVAFVTRMRPPDLVLATSDRRVFVGEISSAAIHLDSPDDRTNLRRAVAWRNERLPVHFDDLPTSLQARLKTGSTVLDLTSDISSIDSLVTAAPEMINGHRQSVAGEDDVLSLDMSVPDTFMTAAPRPPHEHLPDPSPALADELYVDHGWLQEVRDLLDEWRQLVFYGPPGTGKTYIARKLAAELVGPEQVKLVQFHPSYTYEDFFEGYRPTPATSGGTIGFELHVGPMRRLVDRAREHPDQAFVLVIDEINRGHLAKVFGELYFLLEYRDQAVDLLYSPDDQAFTLPKNLYIIGTMNTADRSIALIDTAMRRRFAFVALDPDAEPTRSLLGRWSEKHGLGDTAHKLLAELNSLIDDPDRRIGPAYFMKSNGPDAHSRQRLERTWRTAILPLLQEHHYADWPAVRERYDFATLYERVNGASDGSSDDGDG